MDLAPYGWINPCGYPNMAVTQLKDLGIQTTPAALYDTLAYYLQTQLLTTKVTS
jgi:lipoyl(octanoyl) transferase